MDKFCKVFNLKSGAQVLVTRDYDEEDEQETLVFETRIDGVSAKASTGFHAKQNADHALNDFTEKRAQLFYEQMYDLFKD